MELTKRPETVAQIMDELAIHVDRSLRRPMNLMLALYEEIRAMRFAPEADALLAAKLRDLLRVGLDAAEVAELERNLNALRAALAEVAVR